MARQFYEGIRKHYPRLSFIPAKLRAWVVLIRPFTLFAAILAGFFLYLASGGSLLRTGLLVGLALAFLQASGQCLNQSIEREILIDIANGKTWRPIVRGIVSPKEGKIATIAFALLGVGLAFYLNIVYGLFAIIIAFFALFYTWVKPFFVLNNLWQGISRGLLPFVAVLWSFGTLGSTTPILLGLACGVWVFFFQTTKDWGDVRGDRMYGIHTFPVVLGKRGTLGLMWLGLLSFLLLYGTEFFLPLSLLAIPSIIILKALEKEWVVPQLENNFGWVLYYVTLGLWFFSVWLTSLPL